jgi:hypothetical protein
MNIQTDCDARIIIGLNIIMKTESGDKIGFLERSRRTQPG